jgi:carbonic anhydrase
VPHGRSGAVKAAVDTADSTVPAPGHLPPVLDPIRPAVADVKGKPGDTVDLAIHSNMLHVVQQLTTSGPVLEDRVAAGTVKIVVGRYDLDTGVVEFK